MSFRFSSIIFTIDEPTITPSTNLDIRPACFGDFIPNPTQIGIYVLIFNSFIDFFRVFKFAEFCPVIPVIDT